MSRMQEWLERAARELGLVVRIDVELDLGEGRCVVARAHFPDLGTPMGMLVFRSFAEMGDAERRLFESGYGISVFG